MAYSRVRDRSVEGDAPGCLARAGWAGRGGEGGHGNSLPQHGSVTTSESAHRAPVLTPVRWPGCDLASTRRPDKMPGRLPPRGDERQPTGGLTGRSAELLAAQGLSGPRMVATSEVW